MITSKQLAIIENWFYGKYMSRAEADEVVGALSSLGLTYPDTKLYRYCWIPKKSIPVLKKAWAEGAETWVSTSAKSVQSWTSSLDIAERLTHLVGKPSKKEEFVAAVVGAIIPGHCILAESLNIIQTLEDLAKETKPSLFKEELRDVARILMDFHKTQREWIIHLPDTKAKVVHLDIKGYSGDTKPSKLLFTSKLLRTY
jgi:hypothetical protein